MHGLGCWCTFVSSCRCWYLFVSLRKVQHRVKKRPIQNLSDTGQYEKQSKWKLACMVISCATKDARQLVLEKLPSERGPKPHTTVKP